jgi:hypothetical protein
MPEAASLVLLVFAAGNIPKVKSEPSDSVESQFKGSDQLILVPSGPCQFVWAQAGAPPARIKVKTHATTDRILEIFIAVNLSRKSSAERK